MFDFLKVTKEFRGGNNGRYFYRPTFIAKSSIKDLMTRGGEMEKRKKRKGRKGKLKVHPHYG